MTTLRPAPSDPSRGPAPPTTPPTRYQAFLLLRTVFTVAPILFGLDKFANVLADWHALPGPGIDDLVPGSAHQAMRRSVSSRSSPACWSRCAPGRRLRGRRLAGGHHRQPAALGVLRRGPARLRAAGRRPRPARLAAGCSACSAGAARPPVPPRRPTATPGVDARRSPPGRAPPTDLLARSAGPGRAHLADTPRRVAAPTPSCSPRGSST